MTTPDNSPLANRSVPLQVSAVPGDQLGQRRHLAPPTYPEMDRLKAALLDYDEAFGEGAFTAAANLAEAAQALIDMFEAQVAAYNHAITSQITRDQLNTILAAAKRRREENRGERPSD